MIAKRFLLRSAVGAATHLRPVSENTKCTLGGKFCHAWSITIGSIADVGVMVSGGGTLARDQYDGG